MPKQCCTLSVSPLLERLLLHGARRDQCISGARKSRAGLMSAARRIDVCSRAHSRACRIRLCDYSASREWRAISVQDWARQNRPLLRSTLQ
jgi:hypothetical protein